MRPLATFRPLAAFCQLAAGGPLAAALLLLASITAGLSAAEKAPAAPAAEIANFQQAMAGDNAAEKKSAIRALASKSAGTDSEVFPLLVSAITDRQGGEAAVSALSSRAGKTPVGGTYRVGIDPAIVQGKWQTWLSDWQKGQDIKKLEKKDAKLEAQVDANAKAIEEVKPTASIEKSVPTTPAEDLGKVDRVIFVAGGSLVCYIMSKRTDADGVLISVRVVHPDGAGEETISAALVARIEEDIQ